MATESITHHFCFEGEAADRFINALCEALDGPVICESNTTVNATELHGEELWEFMEKARKANAKGLYSSQCS